MGGPHNRIIFFGGLYWGPPIWGNYHKPMLSTPGPHNKDYKIIICLGSILGSPYFGKLPYVSAWMCSQHLLLRGQDVSCADQWSFSRAAKNTLREDGVGGCFKYEGLGSLHAMGSYKAI